MTLVAVISDTHLPRGSRRLPAACLRRLDDADLILHAGDFVTAEVLEDLTQLAPVQAVYGNMDEAALQETLPQRRIVEVDGISIGIVHIPGPRAGRAERLRGRFPGCAAVVYGHTHVPELTRNDECWILNPGSPTERRSAPSRTMLMLEVGGGLVQPELFPIGP